MWVSLPERAQKNSFETPTKSAPPIDRSLDVLINVRGSQRATVTGNVVVYRK